jgi:hypothetical protein
MAAKSSENLEILWKFVNSLVTPVVQNLIEHYLKIVNKTLSELIDDYQHELYHLYTSRRCCQCDRCNDQSKMGTSVLKQIQLKLLFNTDKRLPSHKKGRLCCCYSNPINAQQLDITLLKCLLINVCKDVIWDENLQVHNLNNFEDFLRSRQHDIYHLWEHLVTCCQCHRDYTRPTKRQIKKAEFLEMFTFHKKKCNLEDACAYLVKSGITYNGIKSQSQLFLKLSNNLCHLRKAVDKIGHIRNSIYHSSGEVLSDEIFEEYWDILKKSIINIQDAIGSKTCTEEDIDQLKQYSIAVCIHKKFAIID